MPYSLPQPSTLDDIYQMNPGAGWMALQQIDGGMRQNEQDLQASQLKNLFDSQNNPQLLQQQALENQYKQARNPGVQAESDMAGMNRDRQRDLYDDDLKAARAKFMAAASEADLKELENQFQRMAYSNDPNERAKGEEGLKMSKEMVQERSKQADQQRRQLELETLRGKNQRELAGINNAAGRYAKSPRGGAAGNIESMIASGKLDYQKAATMFNGMAFLADEQGNEELANKYRAMAFEYAKARDKDNRSRSNEAAATKPALEEFDIKPNVRTEVEPFKPVKPKGTDGAAMKLSPEAEDWVTRAMVTSPKLSREKLIEIGKKLGKF
jgi:hypothetical protein